MHRHPSPVARWRALRYDSAPAPQDAHATPSARCNAARCVERCNSARKRPRVVTAATSSRAAPDVVVRVAGVRRRAERLQAGRDRRAPDEMGARARYRRAGQEPRVLGPSQGGTGPLRGYSARGSRVFGTRKTRFLFVRRGLTMAKLPQEIPSRDLAALLDLTPQRIVQLVAAKVVPKTRHGFVAFPASVQAYIAARVASVDNERSGESALDFERCRRISGVNDIAEQETVVTEGVVTVFELNAAALCESLTEAAATVDLPTRAKVHLKFELGQAASRVRHRMKRAIASLRSGDPLPDWELIKTGDEFDDDEADDDSDNA